MIEITLNDKYELNFDPESIEEEVIENVRNILNDMFFSVPMYRDHGLNATYLDAPIQKVSMLSRVDIINKIHEGEPRARVENIEFKGDGLTGYTNPIVRISINE